MITCKQVCAGYEGKEILHHVNVEFVPGKITVLVGPNGCGKSTLLKSMVGILKHSSGEILVNGKPVETYSSQQLARQVAYLPQNRKAPDISVLKMVLHGRFAYLNYPRRYREEDLQAAKDALRWAGLEEMAQENVNRLSGGMQQKVYIAMALAQNAETVLMDEPTTYLDIRHQLKVMELARRLAESKRAVVMVLHDLSQALRIADEVVVLKHGCVLERGTAQAVYESGSLQSAFGVEIERIETKSGWHYLCSAEILRR